MALLYDEATGTMKSMTELSIRPLTPDRWPDLEALFGPKGAQGGCWCMWWRFTPQTYKTNAGEGNRAALRERVDAGHATGLLAYAADQPVGWVSIAPRTEYERIPTSQTWKPIDSTPVWSIVCFYVRAEARGQGITSLLLDAAIQHAADQGALMLEAYPRDIDAMGNVPIRDRDLYWGTLAMFERAGFIEVARRHAVFPIVRLTL
jgi:GNAT superfamily N-acetyltransferase